MNEGVLKEKSYVFAVRIVRMTRYLQRKMEFVLSKQVLRSGTAIGALVREAEYAESLIDFAHKLRIARKETDETHYWISLLKDTKQISEKGYNSMIQDNNELLKLLTASIKTVQSKTKS